MYLHTLSPLLYPGCCARLCVGHIVVVLSLHRCGSIYIQIGIAAYRATTGRDMPMHQMVVKLRPDVLATHLWSSDLLGRMRSVLQQDPFVIFTGTDPGNRPGAVHTLMHTVYSPPAIAQVQWQIWLTSRRGRSLTVWRN
jgi:hypothetical protein